jgi:hypothetical protein
MDFFHSHFLFVLRQWSGAEYVDTLTKTVTGGGIVVVFDSSI